MLQVPLPSFLHNIIDQKSDSGGKAWEQLYLSLNFVILAEVEKWHDIRI